MRILLHNFVRNSTVNNERHLLGFNDDVPRFQIQMNGLIYLPLPVLSKSVFFDSEKELFFALFRYVVFTSKVSIKYINIITLIAVLCVISNSIMKVSRCGHQNSPSIGTPWMLVRNAIFSVKEKFCLLNLILCYCLIVRRSSYGYS
jgi:hypothetical protein